MNEVFEDSDRSDLEDRRDSGMPSLPEGDIRNSTTALGNSEKTQLPHTETNPFAIVESLLEALSVLDRLEGAVDVIVQRAPSEMHAVVEVTLEEVEERWVEQVALGLIEAGHNNKPVTRRIHTLSQATGCQAWRVSRPPNQTSSQALATERPILSEMSCE